MERLQDWHKSESDKHKLREISRKILASDARTNFHADMVRFAEIMKKDGGIKWPGKTEEENRTINIYLSSLLATLPTSTEQILKAVDTYGLYKTTEYATLLNMICEIFKRYESLYIPRIGAAK